MVAGEASETIACAVYCNHHESTLNEEFDPHDQKSTSNRKKTSFTLIITFHMRAQMNRLNPKTPNHKGFLDLSNFSCEAAIGEFSNKKLYAKSLEKRCKSKFVKML